MDHRFLFSGYDDTLALNCLFVMGLLDMHILDDWYLLNNLNFFDNLFDDFIWDFSNDLNNLLLSYFLNYGLGDNVFDWNLNDLLDLNLLDMFNWYLNYLFNDLLDGDITVHNCLIWYFDNLFDNFLNFNLAINILHVFDWSLDDFFDRFFDFDVDRNFLDWNIHSKLVHFIADHLPNSLLKSLFLMMNLMRMLHRLLLNNRLLNDLGALLLLWLRSLAHNLLSLVNYLLLTT